MPDHNKMQRNLKKEYYFLTIRFITKGTDRLSKAEHALIEGERSWI